jgi:hypothetical protein
VLPPSSLQTGTATSVSKRNSGPRRGAVVQGPYRGNRRCPSSAPSGTCASCGTARTPGSWATARRLARSLGASPTGQSARNVAHREAENVGTCRLRRSLGMHTRARTCRRTASPHRAGALACRTGSAQQECVCVSSPSSKKKREQQDW